MSISAMADTALEIIERLSKIRSADGYNSDIGLNAYWGTVRPPASVKEFFVLHELDEENVLEQKQDGSVRLRIPYVVEAQTGCDPAAPAEQGHRLVADIKRAIWGGGQQLTGNLNDIRYAGRVIFPRDEGSKLVVVQVSLQVTMTENLGAP
ncbi:MAG: hypothetical protein REI09_11150 [Candidatus Dactylopiibacterium sp.]|nr:hypothetical protein [Candidatus Dactylopiibacterium sp.]